MERFDKIHLRDIRCYCILGVYPEERNKTREVIINLTLYYIPPAADNLEEALDYDAITQRVISHVNTSHFRLIETLAESIAGLLIPLPGLHACRIAVEKPGVPEGARAVAVEIIRHGTG
ncbi:MAG: hypothetical protein B0D92_06685 [Spirochaeta sp. LUC14_002_19_P3]|nr:MAG: hypothetical protein B0D92_06685 [Spirochaeta sp. LUC14_002_19_P3]